MQNIANSATPHMTYFRLHLLVMIAYLTVCLFLSRRTRLYPLDFGVFYCFVHRVDLKFTPEIPTKCAISTWKCKKNFWGGGTACGASTLAPSALDLAVPPALNWCHLASFTLATALQGPLGGQDRLKKVVTISCKTHFLLTRVNPYSFTKRHYK